MVTHLFKRILYTVPVIFFVAFFVFSLLYLAPGDPAVVIAGDQATPEQIERIRQNLGLDRPFAIRFVEWIGNVAVGDLGESIFTKRPVSELIWQRLGPTLSLSLLTFVLSLAIAIPLGIAAARKQGSALDRTLSAISVLGFSLPTFVIGYALAYIFALKLGWFPVQGYTPLSEGIWPFLRNLILPALTLSGAYIALLARATRSAMLDVLSQDYIRTARAKGMSWNGVLYLHALKNAAIPVVTVAGIGVAMLIGGAVITESVFAIPGLGRLTAESILRRDYPVIQGLVLLFSLSYIIVNLVVDLLYTILDPRIRY